MTAELLCTHPAHDANRDLQATLQTAGMLQATIRHADTKARILLGLQGGAAAVVLQQTAVLTAVESSAPLIVAAIAAIAWVGGMAVSTWHLVSVIVPQLAAPGTVNRFAFPTTRPRTADIDDQREEAWSVVLTLTRIAVSKHARIRRAASSLIVQAAAVIVLVGLTSGVAIAM